MSQSHVDKKHNSQKKLEETEVPVLTSLQYTV